MRSLKTIFAALAVTAVIPFASASAASYTVESQGTAYTTFGTEWNNGVNDSGPGSATIRLEPAHPSWGAAHGTSHWVSFLNDYTPTMTNANDGEAIENNDYVNFYHSFSLTEAVLAGIINIWADDTADFFVNGVQFATAGGPVGTGPTYATCYENPIGCVPPNMGTYDIASALVVGLNTFQFTVFQRNGTGFGLDYSASIRTADPGQDIPEPATVALLAASLMGAPLLRRKNA